MYKSRLKEKYINEVIPEMKKTFGYRSVMSVPKLEKVVINVGFGKIIKDNKDELKNILEEITNIAGQKPVITKAKKAISNFKTREGMPVGLMVTLRGVRMYEFVDKMVNIALPQVRDFRGLNKKSFDKNGNYSIGIKEHIIFPEVNQDDIKNIFGMEVNITTTAKTDEEAFKLLKDLGFPIIDNKNLNNI